MLLHVLILLSHMLILSIHVLLCGLKHLLDGVELRLPRIEHLVDAIWGSVVANLWWRARRSGSGAIDCEAGKCRGPWPRVAQQCMAASRASSHMRGADSCVAKVCKACVAARFLRKRRDGQWN
ncbi:uncharacterized protein BXZ73DRAFT_79586 [Epithele typhae]|uniref:uncharacterized protein n=1 Tax=Epithele typhae TaxID=378194 RepID=UPI002007FD58|nr:uncharacterized protein BXZ73DRAFT_79586 [Epithele typhae]KAH9923178.1 hypothetical protein BXZ73DRAFT_79586 [Epithele typhae]